MKPTFDTVCLPRSDDFDLEQTLLCGQCFRWEHNDESSWTGIVNGRCIQIQETGESLLFPGISQAEFLACLVPYFDLTRDYRQIRQELAGLHPVLQQAAKFAPGIRILRQDPWEALCSFIISQNNNIPRIRGIISRLCETFGESRNGFFAFPSPQTLCSLSPEDLAPIRCGFRARYIISAAQHVADGSVNLRELETAPLDGARQCLMTICGVGAKVAECTLLYGLHRLEAFPLDVWMLRAMNTLFPGMSPQDFGPYAGIAQQYIFHYSRLHPELFS